MSCDTWSHTGPGLLTPCILCPSLPPRLCQVLGLRHIPTGVVALDMPWAGHPGRAVRLYSWWGEESAGLGNEGTVEARPGAEEELSRERILCTVRTLTRSH